LSVCGFGRDVVLAGKDYEREESAGEDKKRGRKGVGGEVGVREGSARFGRGFK